MQLQTLINELNSKVKIGHTVKLTNPEDPREIAIYRVVDKYGSSIAIRKGDDQSLIPIITLKKASKPIDWEVMNDPNQLKVEETKEVLSYLDFDFESGELMELHKNLESVEYQRVDSKDPARLTWKKVDPATKITQVINVIINEPGKVYLIQMDINAEGTVLNKTFKPFESVYSLDQFLQKYKGVLV